MSDVRLYVRDTSAVNLRHFTRQRPLSLTGARADTLLDEPLFRGIACQ
jgi:hypothetical protein